MGGGERSEIQPSENAVDERRREKHLLRPSSSGHGAREPEEGDVCISSLVALRHTDYLHKTNPDPDLICLWRETTEKVFQSGFSHRNI